MLTCDVPPIEHFNYDDLEREDSLCGCSLCTRYRGSLAEYTYYATICGNHTRDCKCELCVEKYSTQVAYLATLSQRDIYSELSFLVSRRMDETEHTHVTGPQFLRWVYEKIADKAFKSQGWWAIKSPNISLQEWVEQWQEIHLPKNVWGVSGLY